MSRFVDFYKILGVDYFDGRGVFFEDFKIWARDFPLWVRILPISWSQLKHNGDLMLDNEIISSIGFVKITPSGKVTTKKYGTVPLKNLRANIMDDFGVSIRPDRETELLELIRNLTVRELFRASSPSIDEASLENAERIVSECVPVLDWETGDLRFYNRNTRSTQSIHPKVYAAKMGVTEKEIMATSMLGIIDFFPLNHEAAFLKQKDGIEITAFNLYKTPKWVGSTASTPENIPNRILTLLNNVFPDPQTLEYVLCWMYHAISSRNAVYLCMVGPRGVGKTMIADLVGQLVGTDYYQKVDDSILEDKFNSQLDNARLAFYDEISVNDPEKINKLKRFANETTSVQAKGKDAKTIKNYSSGILANNYIDGLQIGPEERRFSIVEIGEKDLRDVMPQGEIDILAGYLNSSSGDEPHEDLTNFGHWLLNTHNDKCKYSNSHTWKGEYYYKISFGGLAQWKQFLVEHLADNFVENIFSVKELKSEYKKYSGDNKAPFPASKTIGNFLYDYRHREGIKIGGIIKEYDESRRLSPSIQLTPAFTEWASKQGSLGVERVANTENYGFEVVSSPVAEINAEDIL